MVSKTNRKTYLSPYVKKNHVYFFKYHSEYNIIIEINNMNSI